MATARFQKGSLKQLQRAEGKTWVLRYLVTRPQDGKRVEGTPLVVGLVKDYPTKSSAKQRVVDLGLLEKINSPQQTGKLTFRQIADHYMNPETGELRDLGDGSQETTRGNIQHCVARWSNTPAADVKVLEIESWLKSLAKENGGKYEWSTVGKIRDAMSVVYQHAQRHELVPAGVEHNPARARKLGGPKIKTKSGYKPVRVTPTQIKKMLDFLPLLQRTMVILCSLTAIRVSECVGLRWSAISWLENKIYIWQRWRRGKIGKPKTPASDSYVALTPELASHLETWRKETPYAKDTDWVFASEKTHGKTPRFGGMLVRDYLYPAAEHAGIIFRQRDGGYVDSTGREVTRFGFHNIRKAVSDYLTEGKKADVRTIQDTLRHENPEMTLSKYTESSLESRLAAQHVMASAVLGDSTKLQ
jgi:integrase